MAHPPFLPLDIGKGLGTGEEEDTPAVEGFMGILLGLVPGKDGKGCIFIAVEIEQPVLRCLGIVSARPAPAVLQFKFSTDAQKKLVRRHGASAEEVLGHPVIIALHHEGVGGTAVAEHMGE